MSVGVVTWSQTASANDVADTAVNWREGQAPSSVNDSARAMMTSVAKWRDDIAGVVLVTGGSGTAYTLATNQVFAANNAGNTVQFTPGSTNTGPVTLAVDGLTALSLRFLTGTDLPAGVLISGSLYQATLRGSEWLLHSSPLTTPFLVPIGGSVDYWGATAPNTNFALMQGQAISRTTYATLFAITGTTYGVGDGSSTFNIPDLVGRVTAMLDAGSARLSSTYFGSSPATLGHVGGLESTTLLTANLPPYTPAGSISVSGSATFPVRQYATSGSNVSTQISNATNAGADNGTFSTTFSSSGSFSGTAAAGQISTPIRTVQPTIICNKIMRIL